MDPCSHWYPGKRPFQAPEVNNMENYFSRLPRLKSFLDLRSYGQIRTFKSNPFDDRQLRVDDTSSVSTPFSHSCKRSPKDAEDQLEAISGAAHAMKKSHGTLFTVSPPVVSFPDCSRSVSVSQTGQLCSTLYRSVQLISLTTLPPLNVYDF